MKILVIDDEAVVLDSCRKILGSEGFQTQTVSSVDEAVAILEKEPFSLLLLDIKMPRHDGLFLMNLLRERGLRTPMVVMSGYTTAETMAEARSMGATAFLPKPFTPDELLDTVHKAITEGVDSCSTQHAPSL
jgi:DNA-binding NtrC family response regulator